MIERGDGVWEKKEGEGSGGDGNVRVTSVTSVVKMKQSASDCLGDSDRKEIF